MQHDCNTVYAFIAKALQYIKTKLPSVSKAKYFSDSAASQYKNYKTHINLCHHVKDHDLLAEWHFLLQAMPSHRAMAWAEQLNIL